MGTGSENKNVVRFLKEYWKTFFYASLGWIFLVAYLIYDIINYRQMILTHLLNPYHLYEGFFHLLVLLAPVISTFSGFLEYKKTRLMAELKANAAKTEAILAGIGDGISIQDRDFRIIFENSIHKKLFGENVGTYCYRAYQDKDKVCDGCPVAMTFRDGKIHTVEREVPSGEGTRYFEITTSPLRDHRGEIAAGIEVVREITKRKAMEEALKESEKRFKELAESLPQTVFELDGEGNVTYVNTSALETFGYTRDDLRRGLHLLQILSPEDHAKALKTLARKMEGKRIEETEYTAVRKDGSTFPAIVHSNPIMRDNMPVGLRGILIDISERKKFEADLLRSQKLESIGILAGGIAHDFNNLLTAILGNIDLSRAMLDPEDLLYERLAEAERACVSASKLTRQLLTFSRGGEPIKRTVSLAGLIKDSTTLALRGSHIICEFAFADDLWPAEVDDGQMEQVINNLVINAVQAMPGGGVVRVAAGNLFVGTDNGLPLREGRYVTITVEDQGVGIPKEYLQKIFDPYFTTKQKGSGLGLATTYSIIRNHNGYIEVTSEPGAGSAFTLYLPASEKQSVEKKPERGGLHTGEGRILLMDDEEMIRETAGAMLRMLGYDVEFAVNGEEAIGKFISAREAKRPFHSVIMDLTVPGGMGGKETMRELFEIDPAIRAVASSGYSNDPIMAGFREYGFSAIIVKPYTVGELGEVLRKVLE
ncbi:MAG TPA: PAS domain S-box protein [Dissulfurispiraceae bacterium]